MYNGEPAGRSLLFAALAASATALRNLRGLLCHAPLVLRRVSSIICALVVIIWNGTEIVGTVIFAPISLAKVMPLSTALSASQ
jgi:hypothetical protein